MSDDPRTPCPSWCRAHVGGDHRTGKSEVVRLSGPEQGSGSAFGNLDDYNPLPKVVVVVGARTLPTGDTAVVYARSADEASQLALLLQRMATATPAQHRKLAGQIRAAAVIFEDGAGKAARDAR